jgi:hypothetical protein
MLETGPCTLLTQPPPEGGPVTATWDAGGRWKVRFAMRAAQDANGNASGWKLTGSLVRGEEQMPLQEVFVVTALGLALTPRGSR